MKELVTPEIAYRWLRDFDYGEEEMRHIRRPINPKWVGFLAREMQAGRFNPDAVLICLATNRQDGRTYIANGNHTLTAMVAVGKPYTLNVDRTEHEGITGVRELFAVADGGKPRKRDESLRAYDAQGTLALPSHTDVKLLAAAVGFIMDGFSRSFSYSRTISHQEVLAEMKSWATAYGYLSQAAREGDKAWFKRLCNRKPVAAVGLVTLRYCNQAAYPFWASVASGAGLEKGDPALMLRTYLLEVNFASGQKPQGQNTDEVAKTVASYWNGYYRRQKMTRRPIIKTEKPIYIAGTPYDGRVAIQKPGPTSYTLAR